MSPFSTASRKVCWQGDNTEVGGVGGGVRGVEEGWVDEEEDEDEDDEGEVEWE